MFSDFIKHYDIIRNILRDVFLYGCFSREGLECKRNISSRKVSYEMRRIQQYIEDEYIKTDRDGRYKLLSLTYDFIKNTDNFLVKTYMTKSFTKVNLLLYFYILMLLNQSSEACSFSEIEDKLIGEGLISYDNISSKTIERKLDEMCSSLGVLNCETIKRKKHYTITKDILSELTNEETIELLAAVSLYKNILFPVTIGYYCEGSLKDYIKYEREIDIDFSDCFQYRNLHFHPVIEEEILWQLMKIIHKKQWVYLNYKMPENRRRDTSKIPLRPYKIRYDVQCGRFYLVSFSKDNKFVISRLDRIESVDVQETVSDKQEISELYDKLMKYSWSSVPLAKNCEPETIKLEIVINEAKENYIIEKIKCEATNGEMEKIEEGKYHFTIKVNDSGEMVPWLRSYSGFIKVIQGRHLAKKLLEDWKETINNYGDI